MASASDIREHMDVISSDRKTVGKVDHLEGTDKIKLTKQSSPDGQHHHFIPLSWVDRRSACPSQQIGRGLRIGAWPAIAGNSWLAVDGDIRGQEMDASSGGTAI
jgi:hypothetical protein